jgi:hypothetical protein
VRIFMEFLWYIFTNIILSFFQLFLLCIAQSLHRKIELEKKKKKRKCWCKNAVMCNCQKGFKLVD